jgi:hypothetical protein
MKAEWVARTEGGLYWSLRSEHGGWLGYVVKRPDGRWHARLGLGMFSTRLLGVRPTAREAAQLLEDYIGGLGLEQAQGAQL